MEWISVNDRLPEESGEYLCSLDNVVKIKWYYSGMERFGDKHVPTYSEKYYNENITHWMPLPNPPKE